MIAHSKSYGWQEDRDIYETPIWKGQNFFLFNEGNDIVVEDNIYHYMMDVHGDMVAQSYDNDVEMFAYLKQNYDCEVYVK